MGNETQAVDYTAVLADLEARKAQIDAAIAVITAMVKTGLPPAPVGSPNLAPNSAALSAQGGNPEIQSDTFFSLSILDATRKFLAMRKRPVPGADIVDALRKGGQVHSLSETFGNTLGSILSRSEGNGGPVVRVGRGTYGLREWYSNKNRSEPD